MDFQTTSTSQALRRALYLGALSSPSPNLGYMGAISWHWLRPACSGWPAGFESTSVWSSKSRVSPKMAEKVAKNEIPYRHLVTWSPSLALVHGLRYLRIVVGGVSTCRPLSEVVTRVPRKTLLAIPIRHIFESERKWSSAPSVIFPRNQEILGVIFLL